MSKLKVVANESQAHFLDIDELIRAGARDIIANAIKAELQVMLDRHQHLQTAEGLQGIVRNGFLPKRTVVTPIGDVPVQVPKVRDRTGSGIKFNSSIIPPYLKRSKKLEEFIPWLYLRGISSGDMSNTLSALIGEKHLISPDLVGKLKQGWEKEFNTWKHRSFTDKTFVYIWADGIYSNVRMDDRLCILVVMGVDEFGHKHLLAVHDGVRESEQSWTEVLVDLTQRGLNAPKLAIGDGALGFWKALSKICPSTAHQRCWVHKTANVLNKLPKSAQSGAKQALHEIWMSSTKANAQQAFSVFERSYQDKYPKAVECLVKDRASLMNFYDFPAAHWQHIRTSNPIESTFATIRLRTTRTKNCGSQLTTLAMIFKLAECASKGWRKLKGFAHLAEIIQGVQFKDGIQVQEIAA
jgi:putative transposase